MLGSLDCMHWDWKNCPTAWAGQYKGKEAKPSIVLEAVATDDLWIWPAFFGMPGTSNDIIIVERSPIFDAFLSGTSPLVRYTINGNSYDKGRIMWGAVAHRALAMNLMSQNTQTLSQRYYLVDGIYPRWSMFVQAFSNPDSPKKKHFTQLQEVLRKDIERAFGVLQAKWHIIRNPSNMWHREDMHAVMMTCIILHNMMVEPHA